MNFQTLLEELDRIYDEKDTAELEEAATGFKLDGANMNYIEDIACEVAKRKDCDMEVLKDYLKDINKDITAEDLTIAAKQSQQSRQIKSLASYMRSKGFNTFGDFAKALKVNESLKEAAEDEEILVDDEPIIDDEAATEEAPAEEIAAEEEKQVILECANCGALVIKAEAELEFDESSDLMNTKEACQYCEAEEGYKIIGAMIPYDIDEEVMDIVDDETVE